MRLSLPVRGAMATACALLLFSFSAPAAPKPKVTHAVSGEVTGLEGTHRVTMKLSGVHAHSITSKTDGTFLFRAVQPGSYTLRPVHPRYVFSPTFRTIQVRDEDRTDLHFKAMIKAPKKR